MRFLYVRRSTMHGIEVDYHCMLDLILLGSLTQFIICAPLLQKRQPNLALVLAIPFSLPHFIVMISFCTTTQKNLFLFVCEAEKSWHSKHDLARGFLP